MKSEKGNAKAKAETNTGRERTRPGRCYRPNVDILERADELLVLADVPGASRDSINVKFEDGTLEIHAVVPARQDEGQDYLLQEYGVGDYYRTFQVSEAIDVEKISAAYANGVLTLRLPKAEAVKPRRIAVTTA